MSKRKKSRKTTRLSLGGFILVVIIAGIAYFLDGDLAVAPENANGVPFTETSSPTNETADWYEIYFTDPTCPPEEERQGGIDEIVADDILQAEAQVDVAAFDFDSQAITDALVEVAEQGIVVRMVTDTDNMGLPQVQHLLDQDIPIIEDERSALMHNKFIIIDGRFVWMGSMNFTTNGVYCNNNNLVRIDSSRLANNYLVEMDEMFENGEFGPRSTDNTPNERLTIQGVQIENYFAPEKELAPIIGERINEAQQEILFMAFSFTIDLIGEPMLEQAENGLTVRGVFETTGSNTEFSYYPIMMSSGLADLSVRQDGNSRVMHHKVIILDQETVIFGSFNFSNSANDDNDENILIVHDPTFASFFVEEFEFVWDEAAP